MKKQIDLSAVNALDHAMEIHDTAMSGLAQNPRIYAPMYVCLLDQESHEVEEALYEKAAQYCADIQQAIKTCSSGMDLMDSFTIPDEPEQENAIRGKIESAHLSAEAHGDSIYSVLELSMKENLTVSELNYFIRQIETQYIDGIGAKLELMDIAASNGDMICIRLSHDGLYFMTGTAFEAMKDSPTMRQSYSNSDQTWSQTMR